jgi:adsorption protein B
METFDLGYSVWYAFRLLFIALVFVFLFSGLDDLFIDLVFYVRLLYRKIFRHQQIKPVTREQLAADPEKPIAILIPAWDESNIIQRMLLNTAGALDYKNFTLFVGVYPNDEATVHEAQKARELFPNIEVIITPADGPTNKADCLNWIYQGILIFEKEHDIHFEAFVMHDAEDIVHPLWLKFVNRLVPRVDFIQLPVFALEGPWSQWVAGVYRDEFAENHTKDMRAREVLANSLPSAGVGTALSRRTIEWLARERSNQIFDIKSLTEDYLLGILLSRMRGKKIFLQQWVEFRCKRPGPFGGKEREVTVRQPVATREFFPSSFRAAVRQKSRWILGISLHGWSAGWARSFGCNYFLYRDRKALITNLAVVAGYVVVFYWAGTILYNGLKADAGIPPLVEMHEPYFKLAMAVMGIFAWRIVNRVVATTRIYGPLEGLLAVPRLLVANIVNFCATVLAIHRGIQAKVSGKTPAWGKTEHAWPSEEQMRQYRRKLGDLLLDRRMVTTDQLEAALAVQKQQGGRLGEILVCMGVLWEEDVVQVVAAQENKEFVEIDPYARRDLLSLVPRALAEQYRIFPLALEGDTLILAKDAGANGFDEQAAGALLGRRVVFHLASGPDIDFAIGRAYDSNLVPVPNGRLGEQLVKQGLVTPERLAESLRVQKRTDQRLGDIFVGNDSISREELDRYLKGKE